MFVVTEADVAAIRASAVVAQRQLEFPKSVIGIISAPTLRFIVEALACRRSQQVTVDLMLHIQHMGYMSIKARPRAKDVIAEMAGSCVLMRTRLISRVVTAIHDEELRPFGIGSAQFALLVVIFKIQPATRSEIGRFHHQDRSTLTRNLRIILAEGWAREDPNQGDGKRKPIVLTQAGTDLLLASGPAWRASQIKSKALLGDHGSAAVMDMADRIMKSPNVM